MRTLHHVGFHNTPVEVKPSDEFMEIAHLEAKASMPTRESFANHELGGMLAVKIPLEGRYHRHHVAEYVWAAVAKWDEDDRVLGILLENPKCFPHLSRKDPIEFPARVAYDWMVRTNDGETRGARTNKVAEKALF